MRSHDDFCSLVRKYSGDVDFVMVYTSEAHPVDGNCLKSNLFKIRQHQHLDDRIDAARNILNLGIPCPLLIDTMSNEINSAFVGSIGRFAMVEDGRVVRLTTPGPLHHHPKAVELWLAKRV